MRGLIGKVEWVRKASGAGCVCELTQDDYGYESVDVCGFCCAAEYARNEGAWEFLSYLTSDNPNIRCTSREFGYYMRNSPYEWKVKE